MPRVSTRVDAACLGTGARESSGTLGHLRKVVLLSPEGDCPLNIVETANAGFIVIAPPSSLAAGSVARGVPVCMPARATSCRRCHRWSLRMPPPHPARACSGRVSAPARIGTRSNPHPRMHGCVRQKRVYAVGFSSRGPDANVWPRSAWGDKRSSFTRNEKGGKKRRWRWRGAPPPRPSQSPLGEGPRRRTTDVPFCWKRRAPTLGARRAATAALVTPCLGPPRPRASFSGPRRRQPPQPVAARTE